MMHKEEKAELLRFCMEWHTPLSNEFINAYCEFKDDAALRNFAKGNGISINRLRKKKE